jgi:hypothetical protein
MAFAASFAFSLSIVTASFYSLSTKFSFAVGTARSTR